MKPQLKGYAQIYARLSALITLGLLSSGVAIHADELLPASLGGDELPEVLVFNCDLRPEIKHESVQIFNRKLNLPVQFRQSDKDDSWYGWEAEVVGPDGEPDSIPFASLWIGTWKSGPATELLLKDFAKVSSIGENGFGLDIFVYAHHDESRFLFAEVIFVREQEFLKVVSAAPVDWASLMSCFE